MIINWRTICAKLGKFHTRFKYRHHKYDAWLHFGSADVCNLRCSYCISDSPGFPAPKKTGGKITEIRIDALMRSLEQSGLIYRIVFAGSGEPFLIPNFVDAICALTGKHLVGIHTNLTLEKPVFDLITRIKPERVLRIHASAHLKELERTGRMNCFVRCFHALQRNGFPVTAEAVAHPDLLAQLPDYKLKFQQMGIDLKFSSFLGEYQGREYPDAYSLEEREAFDLGNPAIFHTRGKLCNAGFNVGLVLPNGDIQFCSEVDRKIGNIYERISFHDAPVICPAERCRCPFYAYDKRLFRLAEEKLAEAVE